MRGELAFAPPGATEPSAARNPLRFAAAGAEAARRHRRSRSLNSVQLTQAAKRRAQEFGVENDDDAATQCFPWEEAHNSLRDVLHDTRETLKENVASLFQRAGTSTIRRSLRWYGSAASLNESMVPATYLDVLAIDAKRSQLLETSRRMNPVDVIWRVDLALASSIVPRVLNTWAARVILGIFVATTACRQQGVFGDDPIQRNNYLTASTATMSIFVSFVIVFYSNNCYVRFYRQAEAVRRACRAVVSAVSLARGSATSVAPGDAEDDDAKREAPEGVMSFETMSQLWRFMNLAHVAGYCALSPMYNRSNLFEAFSMRHKLIAPAERDAIGALDVESETAMRQLVVWALQVISEAADRGEIKTRNEALELQQCVLDFRGAMQSLFDERFQEIPFAYSHLVSFVCFIYLVVLAVEMGLKERPLIPAIAIVFTTVVSLGLLTLGKSMSQPTGLGPESFPIHTYLDNTAKSSKRILMLGHASSKVQQRVFRTSARSGSEPPPLTPPPPPLCGPPQEPEDTTPRRLFSFST
ncbi:hypothetical protein M885DRAFT_476294 [Pelagophyceae sp. CCMP2097]|nr:hypothetical protein M885DRAFT_476294 [Pelagophyceae sp. CCMP2097]